MGQPSRRVLNSSPATLEEARLWNLPSLKLQTEQAVPENGFQNILLSRLSLSWPRRSLRVSRVRARRPFWRHPAKRLSARLFLDP